MPDSDRAHEIVTLRDGRKVKVVELTGLDEMIADKIVGAEMTSPAAGMLQQRKVMLAFSITEIDGQALKRPHNLNEVRAFAAQFKQKDWQAVQMAYFRLNDLEGEAPAAE